MWILISGLSWASLVQGSSDRGQLRMSFDSVCVLFDEDPGRFAAAGRAGDKENSIDERRK